MRALVQHRLCPCCRFVGFRDEPGGTYTSCDVCAWEDDDPQPARGADSESAIESRAWLAERLAGMVRLPHLFYAPSPAEARSLAAAADGGGVYAGPTLPSSST